MTSSLQAFSLPGSMYLSILGGAVWGVPRALPLACCCVATGATLCYLISAALGPALLTLPKWKAVLASELGEEYNAQELGEEKLVVDGVEPKTIESISTIDDLRALAMECATFLLQHNAEPDAVDLLEELEIVDRIVEIVDENTFSRVSQYMVA